MLRLLGLLGLLGLERRFLLRAAGPAAVQGCRVPQDRDNEQTNDVCTRLPTCASVKRLLVLAVRKGTNVDLHCYPDLR